MRDITRTLSQFGALRTTGILGHTRSQVARDEESRLHQARKLEPPILQVTAKSKDLAQTKEPKKENHVSRSQANQSVQALKQFVMNVLGVEVGKNRCILNGGFGKTGEDYKGSRKAEQK